MRYWSAAERLPWRLFGFLDDAHHRTVLVQVGGVYRFRHARLREHLVAGAAQPGTLSQSGDGGGGPL
jgi:hypothetical protein